MRAPTPPLAMELIEREMKEQTGSLILSDCGLEEFPSEVLEMTWLTKLVITNNYDPQQKKSKLNEPNYLSEIPREIQQLQNLEFLQIGSDSTTPWGISEVPFLLDLKNLHTLALSGNRISTLSAPFPESLKVLSFYNNELTEVPFIEGANQVEYLNLGQNRLTHLGNLDFYTELKTLILHSNQIEDASQTYPLEKLEILDLAHNTIFGIEKIGHKDELRQLHLNNNKLQNIQVLEEFKRLEFLDLSDNEIYDVSALGDLIKLRNLYLNNNNINGLSFLERLTGLRELWLDRNQFSDISLISKLTFLKRLSCEFNLIETIEPLKELENLSELYLSASGIRFIEPLIHLPRLEKIRLDENLIEDVPDDIWKSNDIQQIKDYFSSVSRDKERHKAQMEEVAKEIQQQKNQVEEKQIELEKVNQEIEENFKIPAEEIGSRGFSQQEQKVKIEQELKIEKQKLEEKEAEKEKLETPGSNDVKLIFVGNSDVGKTQLSQYLESDDLNTERNSTHGIRLNRWLPEGTVSPAFEQLKDSVAVNIWDFGGQEYYHGTFRLFLSNYAVYVLLWENKTNVNKIIDTPINPTQKEQLQHYHYRYWLDNIRHYAPNSPIIIVQNKIDTDKISEINTQLIEEYKIDGTHAISLYEAAEKNNNSFKWRFDLFAENLSQAILQIPKTQATYEKAISWTKIRDAVVEVNLSKKKNPDNPFSPFLKTGKQIRINDFKKACKVIEPDLSNTELDSIPRWLHNSGIIIYFHKNSTLNNRVYLNPTWVTEGIYDTLNETVRKNKGDFTLEDIPKPKRGKIAKTTVVELMKEMEIIFEKEVEENDTLKKVYVAPQYLPETHPIEDLYDIAASGLQRKAYYVKLPLYFFRKVLQRMIFYYGMSSNVQNVQASYYWKKGILFEKNDIKIMFKGYTKTDEPNYGFFMIGAEPKDNYSTVQGEVFSIIVEILRDANLTEIAKKSLEADEQGTPGNGIHILPEDWTRDFELPTIETPGWLKNMEISVNGTTFVNYLDLCTANRNEQLFIHPKPDQAIRIHDYDLLLDHKAKRPLKVFFSYSHKDTEYMNKLAVHLAPLKRLDKIEVWSDQAIQAGDEWDAAIKNNMKDSDIILLLISADFVASSYIWKEEISLALKLSKNSSDRATRIIPIYLRPFDFKDLFFSKKEIVPKQEDEEKLLAISQWENIDEAFTQVAKDIREVIDGLLK